MPRAIDHDRPCRRAKAREIVERMRARGVSTARFADSMGYAPHTVYAWINDVRAAPTAWQLADLIEAEREMGR